MLHKSRRTLKLIVKPKPSFEIPPSAPDPFYQFPQVSNFFSTAGRTPRTLSGGRRHQRASSLQGSVNTFSYTPSLRSGNGLLGPIHNYATSTPTKAGVSGRYLQVPSPSPLREFDLSFEADDVDVFDFTPNHRKRLRRTRRNDEQALFYHVYKPDDGTSSASFIHHATGTTRLSRSYTTDHNQRSQVPDKVLSPITEGNERFSTPASSSTIFLDAVETMSMSSSLSGAAITASTAQAGDANRSTQHDAQFNLPSFRLERPSLEASSITPSSPVSPLVFSDVFYSSDSDNISVPPSPLAKKREVVSESRGRYSILSRESTSKHPIPVDHDGRTLFTEEGRIRSAKAGSSGPGTSTAHTPIKHESPLKRLGRPCTDDVPAVVGPSPSAASGVPPTLKHFGGSQLWGTFRRQLKDAWRKKFPWLQTPGSTTLPNPSRQSEGPAHRSSAPPVGNAVSSPASRPCSNRLSKRARCRPVSMSAVPNRQTGPSGRLHKRSRPESAHDVVDYSVVFKPDYLTKPQVQF